MVLSSGYILWMVQRVLHGPADPKWEHLRDSTSWPEWTAIVALIIPIVLFGIYPAILAEIVETGLQQVSGIVTVLEGGI